MRGFNFFPEKITRNQGEGLCRLREQTGTIFFLTQPEPRYGFTGRGIVGAERSERAHCANDEWSAVSAKPRKARWQTVGEAENRLPRPHIPPETPLVFHEFFYFTFVLFGGFIVVYADKKDVALPGGKTFEILLFFDLGEGGFWA